MLDIPCDNVIILEETDVPRMYTSTLAFNVAVDTLFILIIEFPAKFTF